MEMLSSICHTKKAENRQIYDCNPYIRCADSSRYNRDRESKHATNLFTVDARKIILGNASV